MYESTGHLLGDGLVEEGLVVDPSCLILQLSRVLWFLYRDVTRLEPGHKYMLDHTGTLI